jgi:hypothetical protein
VIPKSRRIRAGIVILPFASTSASMPT